MFCFLLLLCFWNPVRSSRASSLLYGTLRFDPSLSVLRSQKGLSQDPPSFFPFPCAATCACGSLSVAAGERCPLTLSFPLSVSVIYMANHPPTAKERPKSMTINAMPPACLLRHPSLLFGCCFTRSRLRPWCRATGQSARPNGPSPPPGASPPDLIHARMHAFIRRFIDWSRRERGKRVQGSS